MNWPDATTPAEIVRSPGVVPRCEPGADAEQVLMVLLQRPVAMLTHDEGQRKAAPELGIGAGTS
jgi:hypothetical protein